jgi:hypothetical protein
MKPQFKITSVIRLQIDHDDCGRPASKLVMDFMRWCAANDVIGYRGSTGPEGLVKYFEVRDKPEIREWLHGASVIEIETE